MSKAKKQDKESNAFLYVFVLMLLATLIACYIFL